MISTREQSVSCIPDCSPIVSGAKPLCLRIIFHTTSFQPAHEKTQPYAAMRFHGMVELFCSIITFYLKSASTLNGIFICPAPYWQGVCRADWLNLSIVRRRERFPLPARPPACCSGCPHRAEVSLWLPLELPATESPAPDAACCLPSPVTVLRFTQRGRQVMAKLIVRCNFIKGKPFIAAAYWYSVVKFPTFRRKAYGSKQMVKDHVFKPVISIQNPTPFF